MAWQSLKTDYKDIAYSGLKKYTQIDNDDGTVSFRDETSYVNRDSSFFGANDANKMNEALNYIMTRLENGTDLYSEFQSFFRDQKQLFTTASNVTKEQFEEYVRNLKTQSDGVVRQMEAGYEQRITSYEAQQNAVFDLWFNEIKATLSGDVAGNLQNQITTINNSLGSKLAKNEFESEKDALVNQLNEKFDKIGGTITDDVTLLSRLKWTSDIYIEKSGNNILSLDAPIVSIPTRLNVTEDISASDIEITDNVTFPAKFSKKTASIPSSGWESVSGAYPKRYKLMVDGLKATDYLDIVIDKASMAVAQKAELCPTVEEGEGYAYIYAKRVPTSALSVSYKVVI